MSDTNVVEIPTSPLALSDTEKLKFREIQLKISNIAASKLKLQNDFNQLEKSEEQAVEEYNGLIEQFRRDGFGIDYGTLNWVAVERKE